MSLNEMNCLVAQSGGPTSAINSSLSGVIEASLENSSINTIYGAINGIQGVLRDEILNLSELFDKPSSINTLKTTPSMFLGSCRYKLPTQEDNLDEYKRIFAFFDKYNIKFFFYIGGNDSMDTVLKLNNYAVENNYDIRIMGIPKTIDNDLMDTDHTPGFGSAAKYVATTLLEISHDAYCYNIPSVTIVEIMGRNAGWLTAASALARNDYINTPDLIYLPEVAFCTNQFIADIKEIQKTKKNVIIAVSEGIKDETGQYISATAAPNDSFGHAQLSGTGHRLEQLIKESIDCKIRSVELNVLQRSAAHIASLTDIMEASEIAKKAVEFAVNGETGKMVTMHRTKNAPYTIEITTIPVSQVANKEKKIPREWINDKGNNVNQPLIDYIKPLIQGEVKTEFNNGLPTFFPITHLTQRNHY
ncbi:6-phosphofructokinase 1 [Natranaerovirga hydrolytica]|uniref:Pyrophosphate--fructose 6-phosphate 1-phosphotransferase n=1 Tax=Natranaerovirga hydrolytica TaxID=680378 RepID=A0A4R1MLU7_9FIRM|nr:6-phosphofructokinase [Natranaerovirga hydrolytica]TCK92842.1 6-phosphofructokinase 1 [Natranaerovirga hydrolytica]